MTDEIDEDVPLGEVSNAPHAYDLGVAAANYPPERLIGDENCVRDGETWPLPVLDRFLEGGWDSRCFELNRPPEPGFVAPIDVRDCHWQNRIVQAIDLIYKQDSAAAIAYLTPFLPGCFFVGYDNSPSTVPGCVIVIKGPFRAIISAGTTTPQQWALQGLTGAAGLQNFGQYSTLLFWFVNAQLMLERLHRTSPTADGPILYAGHSYGAALMCILAARTWLANHDRGIQLITYGCPKPGDIRLATLINQVSAVHFVNDGDPVTFLPPSREDAQSFGLLVPEPVSARWLAWERPFGLTGLTINGVRYDSPLPRAAYRLMLQIVQEYIQGEPIEVITAHLTEEYARRIQCPADPVPSPDPGLQPYLWLQGESLGVYTDTDPVPAWSDSSIYANPALQIGTDTGFIAVTGFSPPVVANVGNGASLTLTGPLAPAADWTLFVVFLWGGFLSGVKELALTWSSSVNSLRPSIRTTGIGWSSQTAAAFRTVPDTRGVFHLFQWRKRGANLVTWLDRALVGTQSLTGVPALIADKIGIFPTTGWTSPAAYLAEVVFLDGTVSDPEALAWTTQLCDQYGIP